MFSTAISSARSLPYLTRCLQLEKLQFFYYLTWSLGNGLLRVIRVRRCSSLQRIWTSVRELDRAIEELMRFTQHLSTIDPATVLRR